MSEAKRTQIDYVLFDMDGLLSELKRGLSLSFELTLHSRIVSNVINEILGRYGLHLTWDIKAGLMGKVQRAATEYLYSQLAGLEEKLPMEEYVVELNRMLDEQFRQVPLMPGALDLVQRLHKAGVPIALATSSNSYKLNIKTSHLPQLFSLFPAEHIVTADSPEIAPGRGKPEPDIFLAAARRLGRDVGTTGTGHGAASHAQLLERAKGLVFEDSVPGVHAGVAAGMNVVWVPVRELRELDPETDHGAKQVLSSLEDWGAAEWGIVVE